MGNSVVSSSRSSDVAVIDLGLRDEQLSYIVILISVSTTDGKSIIGLAINRLLSATPSLLQSEIGVARNRSSNFLRGSLLCHYPLLFVTLMAFFTLVSSQLISTNSVDTVIKKRRASKKKQRGMTNSAKQRSSESMNE